LLHALLLLQLLATPAPHATKAEEEQAAAITEYDMSHFELALRHAEEAYRLDPRPEILFNLAQCHRGLHHWDQAAFLYKRYLAKLPDAPNHKIAEELLAEMQQRSKDQPKSSPPALGPKTAGQAPAIQPPPVVLAAPPVVLAPEPPTAAPPTKTAPEPPIAAPPAKTAPAPAAAIEPRIEKPLHPRRSHATSYALGAVAVVGVVLTVIGIVYVENFESVLGRLNSTKVESYAAWTADEATAASEQPHARGWEWVAGVSATVAAATGTSAVLTW
jgi:hypothetical protein